MLERITVNKNICHGQPCIRETRIMVYLILELIEAGITPEETIKNYYPELAKEDIQAAIHYAASLIKDEEFIPFTTEAIK